METTNETRTITHSIMVLNYIEGVLVKENTSFGDIIKESCDDGSTLLLKVLKKMLDNPNEIDFNDFYNHELNDVVSNEKLKETSEEVLNEIFTSIQEGHNIKNHTYCLLEPIC